jgi:homoserine O-succinyltransferase/O-acetyltransferase
MPVELNSDRFTLNRHEATKSLSTQPAAEFHARSSKCLTIGLINNMADSALEATERQFVSLLDSVSGDILIRLFLYALPGVARSAAGEGHISNHYASVEDLWSTQLDGLIVTGREPLMPDLRDEPYWPSFTTTLEWARENTLSTVWSCLAAHAATLHMDGIQRVRSPHKYFGIFDCSRSSDHPLTAGISWPCRLPHSRWNGLPEDELTACGYQVLTQSPDVGVDTFVKQQKSLFVFFQGHPEYESDTLLLEYRRDVGRYLREDSEAHPPLPRSYFDQETTTALTALRKQAIASRQEETLAEVSNLLAQTRIENTWQSTSAHIYKGWLQYIAEQKNQRLSSSPLVVSASTMTDATVAIGTGALHSSPASITTHECYASSKLAVSK